MQNCVRAGLEVGPEGWRGDWVPWTTEQDEYTIGKAEETPESRGRVTGQTYLHLMPAGGRPRETSILSIVDLCTRP